MSWGASSRWTWVQVFGFQFWVPVFGYQIMCEFRCLYGFVWVKMLELVHARDCFDTFSDETTRYQTKMIKQQSKLCFEQLFVFFSLVDVVFGFALTQVMVSMALEKLPRMDCWVPRAQNIDPWPLKLCCEWGAHLDEFQMMKCQSE